MIRVSVKALIIENDQVLVLENKAGNLFYTLPGGGQNSGETMAQAIERECLEEISVRIKVGDIVFARDYIGANHEFSAKHKGLHQIELIFNCTVLPGESISIGPIPDKDQIGLAWLPLNTLDKYALFPRQLIPFLMAKAKGDKVPLYLGDVN